MTEPATKKTSISLVPELLNWAEGRATELGFRYSFSAYISWLINQDRQNNSSAIEDPEGKKKRSVIRFRCPSSLVARLARIGERERRHLPDLYRMALEDYAADQELKP